MKKYTIIFLITSLTIFTSVIKNSTRELEIKIFNSEEKIKILSNKKEMIMLQNDYLSSPQRLFELKKRFINVELEVLKINQFKYLDYNEKK